MKIQIETKELIIFESALFRSTSSILIGEDHILLVDPNLLPVELDLIQNYIDTYGKNKDKFLLFTHSDYDHIIAYGKFKDFTTIASLNFINNKDQEGILNQIKKFDDEYYISRTYKIEYPRIDIVVNENNQKIQLGSDEYIFFQATGHNKDAIMSYNNSKGFLITGDYLSNIEFPFIYESFEQYKHTLSIFENIVNELPVKIMIPGHGDHTTDKSEMKKRINDSKAYISELERSILTKITFNKKKLFSVYKFPITFERFHNENIQLLKKELGIK